MKTMKIFAAVLGLFLMGNVNMVLAQETERNDSIYGLEIGSIIDGIITDFSFYSICNMDEVLRLHMDFYTGQEKITYIMVDYSSEFGFPDPIHIENIGEGVYKISFDKLDFYNILGYYSAYMSDEKKEKLRNTSEIRVYLTGEHLLRSSSNMWQSNVLTFFFSTPTSLNEISAGKDIAYKYFLLSGIESKEKPANVPFICVTYENGKPVALNKYMIIK